MAAGGGGTISGRHIYKKKDFKKDFVYSRLYLIPDECILHACMHAHIQIEEIHPLPNANKSEPKKKDKHSNEFVFNLYICAKHRPAHISSRRICCEYKQATEMKLGSVYKIYMPQL